MRSCSSSRAARRAFAWDRGERNYDRQDHRRRRRLRRSGRARPTPSGATPPCAASSAISARSPPRIMETCVRCGMCADACHFYVATGDPSIRRSRSSTVRTGLSPPRRAFRADLSPVRPAPQGAGRELEEWERLILRRLHAVRALHARLPDGHRHRRADQGSAPRHVQGRARPRPPGIDGPHGATPGAVRRRRPTTSPTSCARPARTTAWRSTSIWPRPSIVITVAPAGSDRTLPKASPTPPRSSTRSASAGPIHSEGFEASNIGYLNGDIELAARR